MWARNPHGMGFVGRVSKDDKWVHKKGIMDQKEAVEALKDYIKKEGEVIFHFRILSRGKLSPEMTHPFEWSNTKEKRYIFHNGTVNILSGGCDSDSSVLSQILVPVASSKAYKILENLAKKDFGRFVTFIQPKEGGDPIIKVFDGKESVWKDGIWYSNLVHETFVPKTTTPFVPTCSIPQNEQLLLPPPKPKVVTRDDENIEKIINFYLAKDNLSDNVRNRTFIAETYSLNLMNPLFIESIVYDIENTESKDPINDFFKE